MAYKCVHKNEFINLFSFLKHTNDDYLSILPALLSGNTLVKPFVPHLTFIRWFNYLLANCLLLILEQWSAVSVTAAAGEFDPVLSAPG